MESTIPSSQKRTNLSSLLSVTDDPATIPEATKDHDDVTSEQFEDAQEEPVASNRVERDIAKSVEINADYKSTGVGDSRTFYRVANSNDVSNNDVNKDDNESGPISKVVITKEETSVKISDDKRETDTEIKTLLSSGSESSTNTGNGKEFDMLEHSENGYTNSDSSSASITVISPFTIDNGSNGKNSNNNSPEIITFAPSYNNKLSSDGTAYTDALVVKSAKQQLATEFTLKTTTQALSSEPGLQAASVVSSLDTSKSTVLNTPIEADFVQTITTNDKPQLYTVEATTSAAAEAIERRNTDGNLNKSASKSETSSGHSSSGGKPSGSLSSTDSSTPKAGTSPKSTRLITLPPAPKSLVEKIKTNPKNTTAAITAIALGLILIGGLIYAATHPTKTKGFFASVGSTGIVFIEGVAQLVRNFFADPQFNTKLAIGSGITLLVGGIFAAIIYALHKEGQKIQEIKASTEPKYEFPRTVLDGANYCYTKSKSAVGLN